MRTSRDLHLLYAAGYTQWEGDADLSAALSRPSRLRLYDAKRFTLRDRADARQRAGEQDAQNELQPPSRYFFPRKHSELAADAI
ncbi:uncharacterized protein SCHCODRAFT_01168623 [Schizophyllum commune H4-8]|nr:uncharacterized protein SCHCODRAFT_01168623 [Schizophyllum commune H4-8]KAI5899644.1 hypothetical protein SCHCODRAFT_01168623 [Schizophyllum commune H4-8]